MTPHHWMKVLCSGNLAAVLELYTVDAVLVPTYSQQVLQGQAELRRYFEQFLQHQNLCGVVHQVITQTFGDVRVQSGIYVFQWTEGTQTKRVAARFTFVFVPTARGVKISTHHSSEMPNTP